MRIYFNLVAAIWWIFSTFAFKNKKMMLADELKRRIAAEVAHTPTKDQQHAIETFCRFMADRLDRTAMIMRGSAGTGKTTVASAIVRTMASLGWRMSLIAPTGRAAKVFALNSGHPAYTIHRRIYRQKTLSPDMTGFRLNNNLHSDTLFIVDEASMVANIGGADATFGSGHLLDDLVEYVYGGRNCRLLMVGDRAQLPPVGEEESPALCADVLRAYSLDVYEADLDEVVRQGAGSGILSNATMIRRMISHDEQTGLPKISFKGFADIAIVPGDELIETLASSYSMAGIDETIVITRSNKRANIYNRGIRGMVLGREEELCSGDMLMVVKNNYYWMEQERKAAGLEVKVMSEGNGDSQDAQEELSMAPSFIANGDRAMVRRVRNVRQLYGFRFADITLTLPDYDDYELTVTALLDTLTSDAPALTRDQNEQLFNAVMEDYADIPLKANRLKRMKLDKHYNALQIKHAYAVTCHKAQGGQWEHVYIDQGYMTDDMLTPDYIHWLYTAFTRATQKLYLINWPRTQIADSNL